MGIRSLSKSDLRASAKDRICRLTSLTCTPRAFGANPPGQEVGAAGTPMGVGRGVGAAVVSSVAVSASSLYNSNSHESQHTTIHAYAKEKRV